jgi:hypothetical protein
VAGDPGGSFASRLVTGAFGTFQQSALGRLSTEDIWQELRQTVGRWAWTASGEGGSPSVGDLEARGKAILSEQGVGIQQVNKAREAAGEWRGAREQLASLRPDQQVPAQAIFRPPWAETAATGVPEQFRARVQWQITPTTGDTFTKWSTYELTSPLLTTGDVIDQATASMESDRYLMLLSGGAPPTAENLEIEQI